MTPVRGILFDKDGTLIDFRATWVPAYRGVADELADRLGGGGPLAATLLARQGFDVTLGEFAEDSPLLWDTNEAIAAAWSAGPEVAGRIDVLEVVLRHFADVGRYPPQPVGDVPALLGRLRRRGLALGVATMDDTEIAHVHLRHLGIAEQLDFVDPDGTARAVQWYVVQALGDGSCASALGDALASTTCAAPVVLAEPFADAVVADDTVTLSWTRVENALEHDVLLGADGDQRLLGTTDGTSLSVPSAFLEPGFPYLWQVVTRAADAACPETTSTARVVRVAGVAGAPLLTVATPAAGAGADETDVLLEGANLYLGAQVFLGGVPATLLEHDGPDRLLVRAAGLAPGPVEIRVVNPGGGEVRWSGFTWHAGVAGEELLANGDVETASVESGAPTPWILAGNTPPEHSCGAGPDRYVASGVCSVRFRGELRPNGKRGRGSLVQWIALGPGPRPARLHLALAARAKNVPPSARARAIVELYAAGAAVESFLVDLDAGSYPFTTFARTFTPTVSYDAITVTVLYKASRGRLWVDDVHLELVE